MNRQMGPKDGPKPGGSGMTQGRSSPPVNRLRLMAVCLMSFGNALSDVAPSVLLPYMERHYETSAAVLSLIFVANALGAIIAALFIDGATTYLGRAKTYALSQLLIAAGCAPAALSAAAPLPAFVLSFFLIGFGASFTLAMGNVFCTSVGTNSSRSESTAALGLMHGAYGAGAAIGPLIAAAIIASGAAWTTYYALLLGLAVFGAAFASYAFRDYEEEGEEEDFGMMEEPASSPTTAIHIQRPATDQKQQQQQQQQQQTRRPSADLQGMFTAVSTNVVIAGAFFMFAYRGAEVSISSRSAAILSSSSPSSSSSYPYQTSSPGLVFWMGITAGRLLLPLLAPARGVDERRLVSGVVLGAVALELLTWLVPGAVGDDAAANALLGLLLGPVYPCAAAVFLRGLGGHERLSGIGVITAFGSAGGAAAPFTVGILAEAVGPAVLRPIAVGLFGAMLGCWYGLPRRPKRAE